MQTTPSCRITDPARFHPAEDPKKCLYHELYHNYGYAFQEIAEVLKSDAGNDIIRRTRERLSAYLRDEAEQGEVLLCSYRACVDDGEIDLSPIHEELIERFGSLILPVLVENEVAYVRLPSMDIQRHLVGNAELKIEQIDPNAVQTVPLSEVTHMLVPGIPLMTYPPDPAHTGWVMPRHPRGYDGIMSSARSSGLTIQFVGIGVCPHFLAGETEIRDILQKPQVDVLITPSETVTL